MDRRKFVGYIAGAVVAAPLNTRAQQATPKSGAVRSTPSVPLPTPSILPAASNLTVVQMTDAPLSPGDVDGPTWEYANRPLGAPWTHPGGDYRDANDVAQGPTHYAVSPVINGIGDIAIPVKALVARLLANNTGFFIQQTKGLIKLASRTHSTLPGPRLHVVTDKGTFDPVCTTDTWTHPSTNQPMGNDDRIDFPAIVKFDLSAVTGTVTSAVLTVNVSTTYSGGTPAILAVDYLDPPALNLAADGSVVGTRAEGIAAKVAKDNALARHASVLLYNDLVSKQYIIDNFQPIPVGPGGTPPTLADNCDIIQWPQYGLSAARVWSVTSNQRVLAWHHWAEPKQSPPKSWQRDFGNGHTHLFCRYLLEIGNDVKAGMTEQGMKLPGMTGTYDWSTSGAVTRPPPNWDGTWEMRLWHTGVVKSHPDIYHLATYFYGVDHQLSKFRDQGGEVRFTKGYLKAGRVYSIEQEVKLNTLTNGIPNADGVERVWVDGVLMYENTATKIRGYDNVRIQSIPFVNIYHGGMGMPAKSFHYDIGGICVATEYIGPPKVLRAGQATLPVRTTSLGRLVATMPPNSWAELTGAANISVLANGSADAHAHSVLRAHGVESGHEVDSYSQRRSWRTSVLLHRLRRSLA